MVVAVIVVVEYGSRNRNSNCSINCNSNCSRNYNSNCSRNTNNRCSLINTDSLISDSKINNFLKKSKNKNEENIKNKSLHSSNSTKTPKFNLQNDDCNNKERQCTDCNGDCESGKCDCSDSNENFGGDHQKNHKKWNFEENQQKK